MIRWKTVLAIIAIAGIITAIVIERHEQIALERKSAEMREQIARLFKSTNRGYPAAQNASISKAFAFSRDDVSSQAGATDSANGGFPSDGKRSVFHPIMISPADLIRAENFRNAGIATPAASYETWIWAMNHGDTQALASTLYLNDAAEKKALDFLNQLPQADRDKYGTPAEFIAQLSLEEGVAGHPFTEFQILDQAPRRTAISSPCYVIE